MNTSKGSINVDVSSDLVEPIIKAKIQAAIANELMKDKTNLLEAMVNGALTQKVDENGKVNSSSYYNKSPFIEVLSKNAIRDAAKEAMREYIRENMPKIKELMKKQFAKKNAMLAKAMFDGMVNNLKSDWRFTVNTSFDNKE